MYGLHRLFHTPTAQQRPAKVRGRAAGPPAGLWRCPKLWKRVHRRPRPAPRAAVETGPLLLAGRRRYAGPSPPSGRSPGVVRRASPGTPAAAKCRTVRDPGPCRKGGCSQRTGRAIAARIAPALLSCTAVDSHHVCLAPHLPCARRSPAAAARPRSVTGAVRRPPRGPARTTAEAGPRWPAPCVLRARARRQADWCRGAAEPEEHALACRDTPAPRRPARG